MPCTPMTLPGGVRAIVCTRGRRYRCACGRAATIQCDATAPAKLISSGPNAGRVRKAGTCDKHLCASCAVEVGPDRHLCPEHATSGFSTSKEAPEPAQQEMF
jgi:hypothetical protein